MGKIMKAGKVVLVLTGRYAGKKAIVMKNFDDGTTERPYGSSLIAGIERYPRKVTKNMTKAKLHKRSKIKAFVRVSVVRYFIYTILVNIAYIQYVYVYIPSLFPLRRCITLLHNAKSRNKNVVTILVHMYIHM
jgi:hypothetical protein